MSAAVTILSRLDADDAPPPRLDSRPDSRARSKSAAVWRKSLLSALGAGVAGFGLALMPLPGPFGLPVTLLGLILLLKNSQAARRRFIRTARRFPRLLTPIRRLLRHRRAVAN